MNGVPLQGIDVWHEEAWLPRDLLPREELGVALQAWSGTIRVPERRRFKVAQLIWIDEPTECYYYLASAVLKALQTLDGNDLRRVRLLQTLDESFRELDFSRSGSAQF